MIKFNLQLEEIVPFNSLVSFCILSLMEKTQTDVTIFSDIGQRF